MCDSLITLKVIHFPTGQLSVLSLLGAMTRQKMSSCPQRVAYPSASPTPALLFLDFMLHQLRVLLETPMPRTPNSNEIRVPGRGTQAGVHFKASQMIVLGSRFGSTGLSWPRSFSWV